MHWKSEVDDMNKRVTIQDIADALGISRNTVSKAINNSDGIAEGTRDKILQKAVEMGYKQFSYVASMANFNKAIEADSQTLSSGEIAVFLTNYIPNSHFASTLLDKLHEETLKMGFSLNFHRVSKENIQNLTLPKGFSPEQSKGVICVEIFNAAYSDMLCGMDIPILFIDGPSRRGMRSVNADLLLMDNSAEICRFVQHMADRNLTRIGFIGDYNHCQSFWERYAAYRTSMLKLEIPAEDKFIIHPPANDIDALGNALESLDEMPDVFICVNDFVAIDAMQLLAQKDRSLPKKVRFFGFDDSHESRIFYPALSTVHIHSQAMAFSALHLLVTRMEEPAMEYRTIHVETDLVLRESTEF